MFPSCYTKTINRGSNTPVTKVVVGVFAVYVLHTCWVLYGFIYIKPCDTTKGDNCISPYRARNPLLSIFVSVDPNDVTGHTLLHREDFDIFTKFERTVNVSLPKTTRGKEILFAVLYVHSGEKPPWTDNWHVSYVSRLTSYSVREGSFGMGEEATQGNKEPAPSTTPVTFWHPHLAVSIMTEDFSFNKASVPSDIRRHMKVVEEGKKKMYLPLMVVDELQTRMKDFIEINETTHQVHLKISYENISLKKYRLWIHMRDIFYSLKQFGFTERQVDDIKGFITSTNLYMFAFIILAAILNLLFEFLAVKKEVKFWKSKTTMAGMSKHAVMWRCCSTVAIFFHLLLEKSSWLLLIPTGLGMALELFWALDSALVDTSVFQLWKLKKALTLQDDRFEEPERITSGYDSQGMRVVSFLLCPLCISGVTYSLLYPKNKCWYSCCFSGFITGVYAFGFLSGFPQLFVNYKFKSVEHLQSSIYMYKGLSTFINDILSTLLTVPTHPLACFRDDVSFLLLFYQTRLYPVRKTRGREYGASCRQRLRGRLHED